MSLDKPQDPASPPSPPPIYRLSQELIDEIIDTVHLFAEQKWWAHRWDYLANCSLVCRSFAPRAQMHLFTQISLPGLPGSRWALEEDCSRVSALIEIMDNNPLIAKHIQNLNLYLPQGNTSWLYRRPEMLTLMEKINSTKFPLRNVLLSSDPGLSLLKTAAYDSGFPHLHRFFKKTIAPYITTLRIEFILRVPVELVTMCTHLQDLKVIHATFTFREPDAFGFLDEGTDTHQPLNLTVDRNRRPKIQSLEYKLLEDDYDIRPDASIARLLTDPSFLDFSSLRCLTTYTDEPVRNLSLAQRVMDASKGAIVDVMIEMYNYQVTRYTVPSTFLDFTKHPKLESLSYIAFFQPDSPDPDPLDTTGSKLSGISETCKMLKRIASTSSSTGHAISYLRTFDLILTVHHQAEEDFLHDEDWETFVNEVKRIASRSRSARERRGGHQKLELWLNMHYHAPSERELEEDDEKYATGLLERLIDERLGSLKDCACVALERRVDVIHP